MNDPAEYEFIIAEHPQHFLEAKRLFKEYAASLPFDLSFQNFAAELEEINVQYYSPSGGLILIRFKNDFVGCAGIRKLDVHNGELKRMYVQPAHQGLGLGKLLMEKILEVAKERGYKAVRLDTLKSMVSAIKLYRQFEFKEIQAYRFNPSDEVLYLEKQIQ